MKHMTQPLPDQNLPAPEPPAWPPGPPAAAPPGGTSWARRRRIPLLIIAGVLAAGGIGWGVAAAQQSTHSAPTSSASAGSGASKSGTNKTGTKKHHGAVTKGTIATETGSVWTLRTASGTSVQVSITAHTQFGTKKAPSSAAAFTVGNQVTVAGPSHNGTVTARRVQLA